MIVQIENSNDHTPYYSNMILESEILYTRLIDHNKFSYISYMWLTFQRLIWSTITQQMTIYCFIKLNFYCKQK